MSEHTGIGLSSSRRGVPHRAKYKKPIEWKALNERARRRSASMLLIVDEHNKQNKAGTAVREPASHGETSATARRRQGAGRQLCEVIFPSSPAEISAAVVIVAFVVQEGRADLESSTQDYSATDRPKMRPPQPRSIS